jgi:hypothetical protein
MQAGAGSDCFSAYGLGGHGGQCPHRAARGGDRLAVERLLHRHQSLLDARGSRFYRPGGDEDDVAQEARIGFVTAVLLPRRPRTEPPRFRRPLLCAARSPPPGASTAKLTEAVPGEAAERPWTSLQCRENVVDLALAREQLRELGTA